MVDLIVIGAGSGGLVAAKRAASYGKNVILCENDTIGGTCVSYGCVPKKLWHYIANYKYANQIAEDQGWASSNASFDWKVAQRKISDYIKKLNDRHEKKCVDLGVKIIKGSAQFIGKTKILINNESYEAKDILIATGSSANQLPINGTNYCDTSNDFFNWETQPKSVAIIGGGYIATELGSILNALGTEVTIIIRKECILNGFDHDMKEFLQESYIKKGIEIIKETEPTLIEKKDNNSLLLSLTNGESLATEKIIQCIGRNPNTKTLNCKSAEIDCAENGGIIVNDIYQSTNKHVFALGDCIDLEQLTPVAIAQARQWTDMMYSKNKFKVSFETIPTAIFSLPEAASVGLTENDAKKKKAKITIKKLSFNPLSSALTEAHKEPVLMKLVLEGSEEKVIGIHIVGEGAAEIIQALAIAVQKGITKSDLDLTMALHPTITEELVTIY